MSLKIGFCSLLGEESLEKLRSKNICKITEFISKDPEDIAQLTGIPYKDIVSVRNVILAKYSSLEVNGSDFYNSVVQSTTILTTGIKRLDNILDGGLYTGEVTEFAGDIGSGKSQICFSICAATAKHVNQTVVYIDTGADFSASRVHQMASNNSSSQENILSRINVYDAFTVHDVFSVLDVIRNSIQSASDPFYTQLKLVILDNIAAVVYPFLGGSSFSENQGLLSLLGQKLKSLAQEYSVAILIINNIVKGEHGTMTVSLGRLWSHVPNVRMIISRPDQCEGCKRDVNIVKNSRGECNINGELNIEENGLIS